MTENGAELRWTKDRVLNKQSTMGSCAKKRYSSSNIIAWLVLLLCVGQHDVHSFTHLAQSRHLKRAPAKLLVHHAVPADSDSQDDDINPEASMEALDALVPRSKITTLIKSKSNAQGAVQLVFHSSLFGLAATAIPHPTLSLLSMAFVSAFFFNGLHETVHRTAFASKRVNDAVAQVFGLLCIRPARHYFHYHWQHHKYTGNKELDSELQEGSFLDLPVETPFGYLAYLSGIPFWIDALSSLVQHARGKCPEIYLQSNKAKRQVIFEARIYLFIYTVLGIWAATSRNVAKSFLRFWIWPAILGQSFLRFYLLAEHRGRKDGSHLIYENTRTMHTNWFYRKLAWNMPFHMEHHAWPSVPFHKLQDAHQLLMEATNNSTTDGNRDLLENGETIDSSSGRNGYLHFHLEFLKNLFQSS